MTTYDRIETSDKVPANNRIYLARQDCANHERLRLQARIGSVLCAPKPAGVEAIRAALVNAGIDTLVCRDEGPVATRDRLHSYQAGPCGIDEVDWQGYDSTWQALFAGLTDPVRPSPPVLSQGV